MRLKDDGGFALNLATSAILGEGANYSVKEGIPSGGRLWSDALSELLGPPRDPTEPLEDKHRDIARSVQAMYEEAFFHLLDALHERYRTDALVLAGGCGMNSVANGKILERSPFSTSTCSRPPAMPAARSARPSRPGTRSRATRPGATS